MFHRILPHNLIKRPNAYEERGTLIPCEILENLLMWLTKQGFCFRTVSELIDLDAVPSKNIALTFDDGYVDNFEFVVPILKRFGATATFYPVIKPCLQSSILPIDAWYAAIDASELSTTDRRNYISGKKKKVFYRASPETQVELLAKAFPQFQITSPPVTYMSPDQLKALSADGFEIGSHTMTHSLLTETYMTEPDICYELIQSKEILEKWIGKTIISFCFPSGYYNKKIIEMARKTGYKNVCLVKRRGDLPLPLPVLNRYFVRPNLNCLKHLKKDLLS
jgi:peptidoglycan/xylan/chitin deacetylase (PgdA/CDA1 family)